MNVDTFRKDVRNLFADFSIPDERIQVAEKAAFLEMAHYIDLPDAEDQGTVTVTSGTEHYTLTLDSGADVDRITGAVFVGTSVKSILEDSWTYRTYLHHRRGLAETGTPFACCFYNDELWLYYIPNLSGTVYFSCQQVVEDLTDFPDNYYALMIALTAKQMFRTRITEAESIIYERSNRDARNLIKSFKKRMHPQKMVMEKSSYRANRIRALNSLI